MSQQPELLERLRDARPLPPAELREHVRRIAARSSPSPPPPSRRSPLPWRRVLAVAVPVAAAGLAAATLLPGGGAPTPGPARPVPRSTAVPSSAAVPAPSSGSATAASGAPGGRAAVPAPSPSRVQRYAATLRLRVPGTRAISDGTRQAVQVARALGGYASRVDVDAAGSSGSATIVLRVPEARVQQAVTRLSALGTIVGENVSVQDLQARVDATARKIARLKRQLAGWRAQPASDETRRHIAALTAQIDRLGRGRTATIRSAGLATVHLQLSTPPAPVVERHGHGPLHGLAVAFRWAGIGAVYALALGVPLALLGALAWLAARAVRRRREERLLSRP